MNKSQASKEQSERIKAYSLAKCAVIAITRDIHDNSYYVKTREIDYIENKVYTSKTRANNLHLASELRHASEIESFAIVSRGQILINAVYTSKNIELRDAKNKLIETRKFDISEKTSKRNYRTEFEKILKSVLKQYAFFTSDESSTRGSNSKTSEVKILRDTLISEYISRGMTEKSAIAKVDKLLSTDSKTQPASEQASKRASKRASKTQPASKQASETSETSETSEQ